MTYREKEFKSKVLGKFPVLVETQKHTLAATLLVIDTSRKNIFSEISALALKLIVLNSSREGEQTAIMSK